MTGSHSTSAASHALVMVRQAYQKVLAAPSRDDSIVVGRLRVIDKRIRSFDKWLDGVFAIAQKGEDKITKIERAKVITCERALILMSVKTELVRKRDETKRLGLDREIQFRHLLF
jgi:hypothetical protein